MKIEDHLISQRLKFSWVAKFFEYVSDHKTASSLRAKRRVLKKKFDEIREKFELHYGTLDSSKTQGDSIYALVSLMMPQRDRRRFEGADIKGTRLTESTLGPLIGRALGLDENGPDFRNLKQAKDSGPHDEGLSSMVKSVMTTRGRIVGSMNGPWISEVQTILDGIARSARDEQLVLLREILKNMTPLEGKWLTRIILRKKMGFGLSDNHILEAIHPGVCTKEMLSQDLKKLCQEINDPKKKPNGNQIEPFSPFNVMLLSRLNQLEMEDGESRPVGGNTNSYRNQLRLPKPPFIVETKFDGERFTLHYKKGAGSKPHDCFKLLSKKGHDYTEKFEERFLPLLHPKIKSSCDSFILDGEMMVWDTETRDFERKNLKLNIDVKTLDPKTIRNNRHVPVFVAFDIVYHNGKQLTDTNIEDRIRIMRNQVCDATKGVIEFSEQWMIYSKEELEIKLDKAIVNCQEGLVVKQCGSKYRGFRDTAWMKVKPANLEGHGVNDIDVVILGAYFNKDKIGSFLVGLFDESDKRYYPICSVGGGRITKEETMLLGEKLRPHLVKSAPPNVSRNYVPRPDFWIDPVNSAVLQINAYNIKPTDKNDLKLTLQAPIPHQIRDDHSLNNILTRREFDALRQAHNGALVSLQNTSKLHTTFTANVRSQKRTTKQTLLSRPGAAIDEDLVIEFESPGPTIFKTCSETFSKLRSTKFSSSKKASTLTVVKGSSSSNKGIFSNLIFYLVGREEWITKISTTVKENGGTQELKDMKKAHHIIAERRTSRAVTCGKTADVLREAWITHCLNSQKLVFEPDHYWIITKKTEIRFSSFYDKYKNSYTKPVSNTTEMEVILKKVSKAEPKPKKKSPKRKYAELLDEVGMSDDHRRKLMKFQIFDGCCLVLLGVEENDKFLLQIKIRSNGGTVASSPELEEVTHIVIDNLSEPFGRNETAHVVCLDWLKDSLIQETMMDEYKYNPRCASSSG